MRKTTIFLGVLLLLISGLPALADSILPSSITGSLGVGGSITVHKTVTIDAGTPTTSKVDVFFLADTTGSMGGTISEVATNAAAIMAATAGLGNVAWGVGEYKDTSASDPYCCDAYGYRLNQAITTSQAAVQTGIDMWSAGGGGDYPESDLFGLYNVATGSTGWRAGSARILIWMGDAPGHDPGGDPGVTEAQATAALKSMGIKVEAMSVGSGGLDDYGQATNIATATGGTYYPGINSAGIVAAIQAAISTSFANYGNVSLDTSEAVLNNVVSAAFVPLGGYTGSFDRSVARTFSFDVTFTGVKPGTDNFHIYATVDGGQVAAEADIFTVAAPEPSAILLFGLMALGIGVPLKLRRRS
jgi:hypothetical protein